MCGRYKITKPVSKTIDLVKTNIKVEDMKTITLTQHKNFLSLNHILMGKR